jgi:nitrite reductase/ring-hydroxylating ferredoxin subunit
MTNREIHSSFSQPVAMTTEIPPGSRKIVEINGKSIGIFNVNGVFVAVLNVCPHESAPVCMGQVRGTTEPSMPGQLSWIRDGEILACPWHGWEFDLLTGQCLTDRRRLYCFDVNVVDGTIYVMDPSRKQATKSR